MNIESETLKAIETSMQARGVQFICPKCGSDKINLDHSTLDLVMQDQRIISFVVFECLNCYHVDLFLSEGYNMININKK